jgi:two-component system, OmpR family, alkaline phosphatase synthesis response regulator PhoP
MAQCILIADDDPDIIRVVRGYLEHAGFQTLTASDGDTALRLVRQERPDVVVLDLMLPGRDGWAVLGAIRSDPLLAATPIVLLTARVEDSDKVGGLELGADDYITKPFNPHEVVARVKALLRRAHLAYEGSGSQVLSVGRLRLDRAQYMLTVDGREVELTPTEFKLLAVLMAYPGQTLTRDELLEAALGYAYAGIGRALDTHIRNLRRKIEPDPNAPTYVQTIYGIGYRLAQPG